MGTDGMDFHGFLSVPIRKIRVYPCPIPNDGTRMDTDGTDFHGFLSVPIRKTRVYPCPIPDDGTRMDGFSRIFIRADP